MTFPYSALMVQGTTSDAGKSVLVAGICRYLARQGLSVAPFKPQNMALNSAVTADGGEIGRAQALQAQACNLSPTTDMNPVLIKPNSDTGAQIIIGGKARHEMDARAFHDYKPQILDEVLAAFQRLKNRHDHVIIEGAGSPAEINLRDRDIANMGFAEPADVPVIIIADIDRGGVFAHLYGTLKLLSKSEQQRVVGFVINRFRGDISLLQSGLDWLEQTTGKPVLGVLPYLHGFHLDAEDAIHSEQITTSETPFHVVVPVLTRTSNHNDFDPLRLHPQVKLTWVGKGQRLPAADLIILPGTKNVRQDLAYLREQGWHDDIAKHLRYGGKVIGICGGYQLLGQHIADPRGIEGDAGSSQGLGYLPISTELHPDKQLRQVSGKLTLPIGQTSQTASIQGYEIHAGQSDLTAPEPTLPQPPIELSSKKDGCLSLDNQIFGTYVHGIFDNPEALSLLLRWANFDNDTHVDIDEIREQQLNRIADVVSECLDWGANTWQSS